MRCGCKGTCQRNCSCRSAGAECSKWCGCDPRKCKFKLAQAGAATVRDKILDFKCLYIFIGAILGRQGDVSTVDQDVSSLAKTPECPPPPLVSSTVNVPMTGGRRRRLEPVETAANGDNLMRTPECPPPPLSSSTVDVTMNGSKRKKKLFTERLGPQEL